MTDVLYSSNRGSKNLLWLLRYRHQEIDDVLFLVWHWWSFNKSSIGHTLTDRFDFQHTVCANSVIVTTARAGAWYQTRKHPESSNSAKHYLANVSRYRFGVNSFLEWRSIAGRWVYVYTFINKVTFNVTAVQAICGRVNQRVEPGTSAWRSLGHFWKLVSVIRTTLTPLRRSPVQLAQWLGRQVLVAHLSSELDSGARSPTTSFPLRKHSRLQTSSKGVLCDWIYNEYGLYTPATILQRRCSSWKLTIQKVHLSQRDRATRNVSCNLTNNCTTKAQ